MNHSAREVERLKKEEADGPHPIQTKAPQIRYREWTNKATGEIHRIPKGIDPGWDYNPGEAAWGRTQALRLMEDKGPWTDFNPWGPGAYKRPAKIEIDKPLGKLGTPVKKGDEQALRQALKDAIGGDEVVFTDPAGGLVMVTQAIAEHILEKPGTRWDGRDAYFPFIKELIEDPYEVWVSFAKSDMSGRVGVRRKYVKIVRVSKNRTLGLYAEFMSGQWVSRDLFRGGVTAIKNLRSGRMVYGRK